MTWFPPKPLNPADWRRQAEEQLEAEGFEDLEGVDAKRVLHELRVHQLELEMQNEALGEARLEAEAGWERFQDLYDSAPAAYFSLDRWGDILEVKDSGAPAYKTPMGWLGNGWWIADGKGGRFLPTPECMEVIGNLYDRT